MAALEPLQRTETVICSIEVKRKSTGALLTPATSSVVTVTAPNNTVVVSAQAMSVDSEGNLHYDYTPASSVSLGEYKVRYTLTNGSRVTILDDVFTMVG